MSSWNEDTNLPPQSVDLIVFDTYAESCYDAYFDISDSTEVTADSDEVDDNGDSLTDDVTMVSVNTNEEDELVSFTCERPLSGTDDSDWTYELGSEFELHYQWIE